MASPFLKYDDLTSFALRGGYIQSPALTQLSAVFLLSACQALRQKWMWQRPIDPITDAEFDQINDMIDECAGQLMTNLRIGSIMPSVSLIADPSYVVMTGQLLPVSDYPELATVVPPTWIVGTDIQLPDMASKGLFGALNLATVGVVAGENFVTLTEAEMPSHTHVQDPHSHTYNQPIVTPDLSGLEPVPSTTTTPTPTLTGSATATNQPTGGGNAHSNIQESLLLFWYIVVR